MEAEKPTRRSFEVIATNYPVAISLLAVWAVFLGIYYLVGEDSAFWQLPEWLLTGFAAVALISIVFTPIFAGFGVAMASKGRRNRWLGVTDTIALVVSFLYWAFVLSLSFNYLIYFRGA